MRRCGGRWRPIIGIACSARATSATDAIAGLLAGAAHQHVLPELAPARTIVNRLWPLLLVTLGAGVLSVFRRRSAGSRPGFAIIWALAWRRQEAAVAAIEERDGVRFYVDRTSPLSAIRLIRTPGFGGDFLRHRAGVRVELSLGLDLDGPARVEQRVDDEHRRGRADVREDLAVRGHRAFGVGLRA